jgi:hypothetical protein
MDSQHIPAKHQGSFPNDDIRCPCGAVLPEGFLAHLFRHPWAYHPCVNPDCEMYHRYLPPQTVRSERVSAVDAERVCIDTENTPVTVPASAMTRSWVAGTSLPSWAWDSPAWERSHPAAAVFRWVA